MKRMLCNLTVLGGLFTFITLNTHAQGVAVNTDGSNPDASAILDVKATNKGMLVPRVTLTSAVSAPATGLLVYQTGGTPGFYYYNGSAWVYIQNSATPVNGTAAGQVYVTGAAPFTPALQTLSGDATIASNGALTINNNAVTVAKMATSGTLPAFNGSALTNLNANNLASGTVPIARLGSSGTPSAGTFLNGAGAWAAPPAGNQSVVTITTNNVTLNTDNQFVYVNGTFTVFLPANPATGQQVCIFSENANTSINPNGKVFRQAGADWGTSMLSEIGSTSTRSVTLIYNGSKWFPVNY